MNKALEDLQAGRDPLASPTAANDSSFYFFQKAAKWSFWLPIAGSLLFFLVRRLMKDLGVGGDVVHMVRLGLIALGALMVCASLILGLIALCGIPRWGREGILGNALRGIFISSMAIGGFAYAYSEGSVNREAMAKMHEGADKINEDTRKDYLSKKGVTAANGIKRMNESQALLDNASRETTGNTALINKAASAFLQKAKVPMMAYAQAEKELGHLSIRNVHEVEVQMQLDAKRQVVKRLMAANDGVMAFIRNNEQTFKDELANQHFPAEDMDAALANYRKATEKQNALTLKIRQQDKLMSISLIAAIDLLDANWGQWKYSDEKKRVLFNDSAVADQYNTCMSDVTTAAREQVQLQQQLANLARN